MNEIIILIKSCIKNKKEKESQKNILKRKKGKKSKRIKKRILLGIFFSFMSK